MRFFISVFVSLTLLVISNAKFPDLRGVKDGITFVPNRAGFPVPINLTEAMLEPQLFFDAVSEVQFELFTLNNLDKPDILAPFNLESITSSHFNKSLPTRIVSHGWQEWGSLMMSTFKDAYFNKASLDVNLIFVNWEKASRNLNYFQCANYVEPIGAHLASLIDFMVNNNLATLNDITLIGFSLGAHVVGIAGKQVQSGKLPRIIGLDPAAPMFAMDKPHKRLDKLDAKYVEIIHTSTTWLGFEEPLGTTSFYPNHGQKQKGCTLDPTGTCSHIRAYKYFAESIYSTISFYGYPCGSLDNMKKGDCKGVGTPMGGEPGNFGTEARIYFLETNSKSIFARGGSRDMN